MPDTFYKWRPIEDLPADWPQMANAELTTLPQYWADRKAKLKDSKAIEQFNIRLQREWAIETGIIEGLYSIDSGTTHTLIEHGIVTSLIAHDASDKAAEEIVPVLQAHLDAVEALFDFAAQRRTLSTGYIKELHALLTRQQDTVSGTDPSGKRILIPLIRGEWKTNPNNPTRPDGRIHEYTPPVHVAAEMDRLVEMHLSHRDIPPEIESAWLHHRFTQIHPFQDGNGRVARALATLVAIRAGWFPLVIRRQDRAEYIEALEKADDGNLWPLVGLFARRHIETFGQANRVAGQLLKERSVIGAIVEQYKNGDGVATSHYERAFSLSTVLQDIAAERLQELADNLTSQFNSKGVAVSAEVVRVAPVRSDEIIRRVSRLATARSLLPDDEHEPQAVVLSTLSKHLTELTIVFSTPGKPFHGQIVVFAIFSTSSNGGSSGTTVSKHTFDIGLTDFALECDDDEAMVRMNFDRWLDGIVSDALVQWRRIVGG